jgi:hypothetical protein
MDIIELIIYLQQTIVLLITYPERQRERPYDVLATCTGFISL